MIDRLKIGICRTSPIGIMPEIYQDNDYTVEYVKGFIEMFINEHDIRICSPMQVEEEKIFNNQKIHTRYPFVKKISYQPFENNKDLDVLVIFSKASREEKHYIDENTTYEQYIENIMNKNRDMKILYIQYNEVNFDFSSDFDLRNKDFNVLMNSPESKDLILNKRFYGGKNVEGIYLDLTELIFQQRIPAKDNFYNRVGLFNRINNTNFEVLKTPNSMQEYIYALKPFNNEEDIDYIKNDFSLKYNILVDKLQACNFVFVDKNDNEDFYNSHFIIVANNSCPILIDKDDCDIHIELEDVNYFNIEDIDSYYVQRYLKQLRIDIKKYYIKYDLKSKLEQILIED